ncbi:hypothetical protein CIHG_02420 [Coccidioides immitis H538.4]|uniref:Uncharacterized protein n=1 Tax=Coccidioides immitis H538.4 TaxID=396776 RepID=A0A0J8RL25_COCIT|nr:hypothetical protein CIHG_02420 [Coccidioides immitis H538.4]
MVGPGAPRANRFVLNIEVGYVSSLYKLNLLHNLESSYLPERQGS